METTKALFIEQLMTHSQSELLAIVHKITHKRVGKMVEKQSDLSGTGLTINTGPQQAKIRK